MNVRTFLLGALCGAVLFSIVDRLVEERERRLAVRERDSPAADVRLEAPLPEPQSAVTPAPTSGPEEHLVATAAALDQDIEAAEPASGDGDPTAAPPRGAASEDMPKVNEPEDSQSDVDSSSEAGATAKARPDDETWGPFMGRRCDSFSRVIALRRSSTSRASGVLPTCARFAPSASMRAQSRCGNRSSTTSVSSPGQSSVKQVLRGI